MKRILKDKEFILRTKSLGALGELIAIKALVDNGFERIRNLNDQKANFPYGDLLAEKEGKRYVISVKSRNKYQRGGTSLNDRYKLGDNCYENAEATEKHYVAVAYWMAVQFDIDRYTVYFGSLDQLGDKKAIPMSEPHLGQYQCLARNKKHGIDFRPYLNIYKEDKPDKSLERTR